MNNYKIRKFETTTMKTRQTREMIQIAGGNSDIPNIEADWSEHWRTLPHNYANVYEAVLNFEIRNDDVFVVSFIKSGTTWMQEIVWLLLNNVDIERANNVHLKQRTRFLDFSGLYDIPNFNSIEYCNEWQSQRLIKSHLPANMLPKQLWQKQIKTIYVARNVKDVIISSFHFLKSLGTWSGTKDEYIEDFINDEIMYTPYWSHIVDYWKLRHEPNIFFVTFEEMIHDMALVLQELCTFLQRPALNEQELNDIMKHVKFENMKANKSTNPTDAMKLHMPIKLSDDFEFMRRGIFGSYKDELSIEQQRKIDAWSNTFLSKHGLKQEDIFSYI